MINARSLIGTHNLVFITIDALRYDVACQALHLGLTPNLAQLLPESGWEERHSPGNFTYAAHQAFFAGFFPTPIAAGVHARLFAAKFAGSLTSTDATCVFDAPDIVTGFSQCGYHTICIGGVGFFNKQNPLGSVLPDLFAESHWSPALGVTERNSTENQVALALQLIERLPLERRFFLFINISATHQPNCIYLPGATTDSFDTQLHALAYVDRFIAPLFTNLSRRGPLLSVICSDHGTAYGEDGYFGHRVSHPVVWTVPYCERILLPSQTQGRVHIRD